MAERLGHVPRMGGAARALPQAARRGHAHGGGPQGVRSFGPWEGRVSGVRRRLAAVEVLCGPWVCTGTTRRPGGPAGTKQVRPQVSARRLTVRQPVRSRNVRSTLFRGSKNRILWDTSDFVPCPAKCRTSLRSARLAAPEGSGAVPPRRGRPGSTARGGASGVGPCGRAARGSPRVP